MSTTTSAPTARAACCCCSPRGGRSTAAARHWPIASGWRVWCGCSSLPYRQYVLPSLAAEHDQPGGEDSLFGLGACLLVTAQAAAKSEDERARQRSALGRLADSPWCSVKPRKQCVPPEGLAYTWGLSTPDLRAGLQSLSPGCTASFHPKLQPPDLRGYGLYQDGACFRPKTLRRSGPPMPPRRGARCAG